MTYEVLARKWRPQTFDDVVGQDHVTQTLKNAIASQRLAHAYLFVGPRGIGKTSIARILAKALNCADGPTTTPCGTCDSCREITSGNSLDVLEIDGASNNGVDQVRELRETVKYAPGKGKFKIYIIDEVHMLSVPAFNALLKTLEEPPPHVKFMFATTEPQKILPTIISRCQRFDLRRIPVPTIMERLRLIAETEKIKADEDALLAVARGAEGGLRDAESALDQLISFKGKHIAEEDVLSVFGLVSHATLAEMAEGILKGDVKLLIRKVAELDGIGKDFQRLVMELIEYFRNLLICLNVDTVTEEMDLTETQIAGLGEQAKGTGTDRVLRVVDILSQGEDRMRYTLSRRTLLETALIRCARAATVVSLEEILVKINALRDGLPAAEAPAAVRESDVSGEAVHVSATRRPATPEKRVKQSAPVAARSAEGDIVLLTAAWPEILKKVSRMAVMVRPALADARPVDVSQDAVTIAVDPEFADEKEKFSSVRSRKAVEKVFSDVLGRRVALKVVVGHAGQGLMVDEEGSEAGDVATDARGSDEPAQAPDDGEGAPAQPGSGSGTSRHEWEQNETVRKTMDMFGGTIVDVRE